MPSLWPFPKSKSPYRWTALPPETDELEGHLSTSEKTHVLTRHVIKHRYSWVVYALSVTCSSVLLVCLLTGVVISANVSAAAMAHGAAPKITPPLLDRGWFPDKHGHTCGNSSAEARRLGCSFDQLTFSWLPPACPHYANAEFMALGPWRLWTDPHHRLGQDPDSPDAAEDVGLFTRIIDNEIEAWTERREHITHCVYMLLGAVQILQDRTPYARRQLEYAHAKHCVDEILKSAQHDPRWTEVDSYVPIISYSERC